METEGNAAERLRDSTEHATSAIRAFAEAYRRGMRWTTRAAIRAGTADEDLAREARHAD